MKEAIIYGFVVMNMVLIFLLIRAWDRVDFYRKLFQEENDWSIRISESAIYWHNKWKEKCKEKK